MRYFVLIFIYAIWDSLLLSSALASTKSNNWAVLLCTSKYFFNYRHLSNVLSMYKVIKQSGIPDSQIILMNALDVQCDSRNRHPGHMYATDKPVPFLAEEVYNYSLHSKDDRVTNMNIPPDLCNGETEVDYTVSIASIALVRTPPHYTS